MTPINENPPTKFNMLISVLIFAMLVITAWELVFRDLFVDHREELLSVLYRDLSADPEVAVIYPYLSKALVCAFADDGTTNTNTTLDQRVTVEGLDPR
jgi:hypothetical protein